MAVWLPLMLTFACNGEDTTDTFVPEGPWVIGLRLEPPKATERDVLSCEWDELQQAQSVTVAWEIDGVVVSGLEDTTLDGTWFDRGDRLACRVTPVADGAQEQTSNVVRIGNAKPIVTSITITPEEPNENYLLRAEVVLEDPDPKDQLDLVPHFQWFVHEVGADDPEQRGVDEDALGQPYWAKGDTVYVDVWGDDGRGVGQTVTSDEIVIGNAAPHAPVVVVEEEEDGSLLTCTIEEESVDLDGEAVTYSFAWRRFGRQVFGDESTLEWPDEGASYTCVATPSDGEDDGEAGTDTVETAGDPLRYRWQFQDAGGKAATDLAVMPDIDGDGAKDLLVGTPAGSLGAVEGGGAVVLGSARLAGISEALVGTEWIVATLQSKQSQEFFGSKVAVTPDFDGDGIVEIILGAPNAIDVDSERGLVAIVPSSSWASGGTFTMSTKLEQEGMWWYPGDSSNAEMGVSVAGIDVDNDGKGDVLAGALYQHDMDRGVVTVVDGESLTSRGGPLFNDAVLMEFMGDGGQFGKAMGVGDFDGDGFDDLAIAAPHDDVDTGTIYVFTDLPVLALGTDDGPQDTGVMQPSPQASTGDAWAVLRGDESGDYLADSMASGDVDGDGADDLVLGARNAESGAGAAYLWVTGVSGDGTGDTSSWLAYQITGAEDDALGASVAVIGDLDGGGIADVLVGAPDNEMTYYHGGAAYLFSGEDWGVSGNLGASDSALYLAGELESERTGATVAGPGDMDGDGQVDLITGMPGLGNPEVGVGVGGVSLWVGYPDI